jgi:spore coat polysaccharide biosynthesis protein SpsF
MTRTVAILQARMTSSRLPGKVLRELAGRPMMAHQLRRLQACRRVDATVVATTERPTDDPVAALAARAGVACFRGSEHDVLSRFVGAARAATADVVVRTTADCPLLDPDVVDRVIGALSEAGAACDYAANVGTTFPRGLDVEVLHADVLWRMDRLGTSPAAREHVTWFVHERPDLFVTRAVRDDDRDDSDLRLTVDTEADFRLVEALYRELHLGDRIAPYRDVVAHLRSRPDLIALNAAVEQKVPPGAARRTGG